MNLVSISWNPAAFSRSTRSNSLIVCVYLVR
nr:MAG TPA: hypothetical protein [Bacteriophage sp.]